MSPTLLDYEDFDLLIEGPGPNYRARILRSPAGEASDAFQFPLSPDQLENFLLKIGRPRRDVRDIGTLNSRRNVIESFGGRLFEALFHDDVLTCLERSLDECVGETRGLRIRLRLADSPELVDVPWEYLYDPKNRVFFCLSRETPLVRYVELAKPIAPFEVDPPVRVLVVISSPSDVVRLDVDREREKLEDSIGRMGRDGRIVLDVLESATLPELRQELRRFDYHVMHFIGHGGFDERAGDGVLLFEDESRRSRPVSGADLGILLHDHRSLRLVVLNACEGARTSVSDPFGGTAQSLVLQGIPAVIAMQFEITDEAAIVLSHEFYAAVAKGYPVDAALTEARLAVFSEGNEVEWATPTLYMRAPDGRIFEVRTDGRLALEDEEAGPAEADTGPTLALDRPRVLGWRTGRFGVTVANDGNVSRDLTLAAESKGKRVRVAAEPSSLRVPARGRGASAVTASAPTLAVRVRHPVTVRATGEGADLSATGEFVRFPFAYAAVVLVAILALVGAILWPKGSSGRWLALPDLPVALEGAAAAPYDGRVWVVGGISAAEGRPILDQVHVYDPGTRAWSAGPSLPVPLYYAGLASTGSQLYLVGGLSEAGAVDTVYRLDSPTGQWQLDQPLPEPRGAGAAAWDGHRLVFGGGVGLDHEAAGEVWALEGGSWRALGTLQPPREKLATATDQNGTVWFLAGRDPNVAQNAFGAVDVAKSNAVTPAGSVSAVQGPAAVWWPGQGVCMMGGQGADGFTGDVECLGGSPGIPDLSAPRAGLGAAVVGDSVFVVGGYDASHHGTRTVEGFQDASAGG